ncbi:hypothetical protein HID58_007072 [Brassica napus]|uniref:Uncharacterized protein n=1 Tax=Brassica napus TaxID=3708 RepID=A0ABQ8EDB1_BRANA|nr:hypothetical protein HID58_007072 [Brassica napus]
MELGRRTALHGLGRSIKVFGSTKKDVKAKCKDRKKGESFQLVADMATQSMKRGGVLGMVGSRGRSMKKEMLELTPTAQLSPCTKEFQGTTTSSFADMVVTESWIGDSGRGCMDRRDVSKSVTTNFISITTQPHLRLHLCIHFRIHRLCIHNHHILHSGVNHHLHLRIPPTIPSSTSTVSTTISSSRATTLSPKLVSSELRSPQRLNHNPRSLLKLQKLTVLNFSLNSNLLDGLIALVTGAGFWNSLSSVTSLNSPNLLCSSPESLNLLLVIAMVATTIFSSTPNFFQSKSSLTYVPSVPDHLLCQLHKIHTAINRLTNHQQEKSISTASSLTPSPPPCHKIFSSTLNSSSVAATHTVVASRVRCKKLEMVLYKDNKVFSQLKSLFPKKRRHDVHIVSGTCYLDKQFLGDISDTLRDYLREIQVESQAVWETSKCS